MTIQLLFDIIITVKDVKSLPSKNRQRREIMSPERKKAQDKLRRKYGYSTNTNYGRGTILYKTSDAGYVHNDGHEVILDVSICMDSNIVWSFNDKGQSTPIEIRTTKYKDNGKTVPKDKRYTKTDESSILLSLEELNLINTVAHQMAEENKWDEQIKKYNKKRRNK